MSRHKHTTAICMAIIALTVIATIAFMASPSFGVEIVNAPPAYESKLFDTSFVHSIDIIANESDWDSMIANASSEEYIQCSVAIDGELFKGVGIRPKGNSSLSMIESSDSDRYSFKVEFDHYETGKSFFGLDKLALNNIAQDNTYAKDYITYQMMNAMGADSPLSSYIWVTVNGEDWGLYLAAEGVEESFAKRVYGTNYGQIYKPDSMDIGNMRNNGQDEGQGEGGFPGQGQMPDLGDMPGFENMPNGGAGRGGQASTAETDGDQGQNRQSRQRTQAADAVQGQAGNETPESAENQPYAVYGERPGLPEGANSDNERPALPDGATPGSTDSQSSGESSEDPSSTDSQSTQEASGAETQPQWPGNASGQNGGRQGFGGSGFGGFGSGGATSLAYTDDEFDSYSAIFDNSVFNPTDADKKRLIASLKKLNEGQDIEQIVDVERVIRYFAVHNFVLNSDSYTGSMVHNYYLSENNGKLSMIAWDYNLAFGGMGAGMGGGMQGFEADAEQSGSDSATDMVNYPIDSPMLSGSVEDKPMIAWIFSNDEYLALYHEIFAEFGEYFASGAFASMYDNAVSLISPYVQKDPSAFCTYEDFLTGSAALREFCLLRAESVKGQLNGDIASTSQGQTDSGNAGFIDGSSIDIESMGSNSMGFGRARGGQFPGMDRNREGESGEEFPWGNFRPDQGADLDYAEMGAGVQNPQQWPNAGDAQQPNNNGGMRFDMGAGPTTTVVDTSSLRAEVLLLSACLIVLLGGVAFALKRRKFGL